MKLILSQLTMLALLCLAVAGCEYSPKPDQGGNIGSPTIREESIGGAMAPTDTPTPSKSQPATADSAK